MLRWHPSVLTEHRIAAIVQRMKSYLQTIKDRADECGLSLLKAFKAAEIPTSTYYRTVNGETELRHETAKRVMETIEKLHALQQARAHTEELRRLGHEVNRRSIRARFKPRSTG
jgi:predicted transcriptional regulator